MWRNQRNKKGAPFSHGHWASEKWSGLKPSELSSGNLRGLVARLLTLFFGCARRKKMSCATFCQRTNGPREDDVLSEQCILCCLGPEDVPFTMASPFCIQHNQTLVGSQSSPQVFSLSVFSGGFHLTHEKVNVSRWFRGQPREPCVPIAFFFGRFRQHVAFVYDSVAKTQKIYIDGALDKTCTEPWAASFWPGVQSSVKVDPL